MLILLFVLCVAGIILGAWMINDTNAEGAGSATVIASTLFAIGVIVAFLLAIGPCITSETVDQRIEMYQEENAKIEQQIADVVSQYQEYEKDIFTEVSPESAMTLVSLYPELKADSLVSSQIDIYVKNNEKIKGLKEQQINGHLYRWWVYFGK